MLLHVAVTCLSSLMSIIIPFYDYITICSSNLSLMGIQVIAGLLKFPVLMLPQAFLCMSSGAFAGISVRYEPESGFAGP